MYNPFSNSSFLLFCIHHHKVYERQNKSYTRHWVTILSIYVILIAVRKEKLIGLQGDKAIDTGRSNFAAHMISDKLLSVLHRFRYTVFQNFRGSLISSFLLPTPYIELWASLVQSRLRSTALSAQYVGLSSGVPSLDFRPEHSSRTINDWKYRLP